MSNIYVMGAYGNGNLGDDAVFLGIKEEHKNDNVIQIYDCKPSSNPSIWGGEVLSEAFVFPPPGDGDKLIIGGGGLFFDNNNIYCIDLVTQKAQTAGYGVEIQGVGIEHLATLDFDDYEKVKVIFNRSKLTSVRSKESARILNEANIRNVTVRKDFAYGISPDMESARKVFPEFRNNLPVVGINLLGWDASRMNLAVSIVRMLVSNGCNVLHIPHSRHYSSPFENGIIAGEYIWSLLNLYETGFNKSEHYKQLNIVSNPEILLGVYYLLNGIVGFRYHSFIFSDMANIPLFGFVTSRKHLSFFTDNPNYTYYNWSTGEGSKEKTLTDMVYNWLNNEVKKRK